MFRLIKAYLFGCKEEFITIQSTTYGDQVVKLSHVYDGDTVNVNIDGYPNIIALNVPVRIKGIDCPELRDPRPQIKKLALEAKKVAEKHLLNCKQIMLVSMQRDKYFRILADVYADEINIAAELLKLGLAKEYWGGTKSPW